MFTLTHQSAKVARTVVPCLRPIAAMAGGREYAGWANPSPRTSLKASLSGSRRILFQEADR